ncbi:centrosomal protein of 41 kDa B-like isoform X2 [Uloborus diversus]|uniref:centrosomal protein of 41 kDa B-like isoform X2 n=1 Tax=Uloborus diversus TaxID=327109 RepID=UPI002408FC27|nr:centrosomal protein of 41 kDa B-like isoform X2 [Uloborus diversus]
MSFKQKSFQFGQYVPNDKVLNKKIPENPKYKHVKPAVDSGKHVVKEINEHKERQKSCNHRKNEVFKRIKLSTFVKLAIAAGFEFLETQNEGGVSCRDGRDSPQKARQSSNERKMANVIMGIGELDILNEKKKPVPPPPKPIKNLPYLLLDVRDREDFLRCHIVTAKNYPSAMLSRSTGYETEEMKLYKNDRFKLIILYDEDETIASRVATTLIERGYENVFLLSGGLKFALEIFPIGLTTSLSPLHLPRIHHGASPRLQLTESKDHFSAEEIQALQCYMGEAFPTIHSLGRPQTRNSSCSKGGDAATSRSNESSNLPPLKLCSFSARGDSACSSRCTDVSPTRHEARSSASAKDKSQSRKAPWK